MRKDVFVYLSGPMTKRDACSVEDNVAAGLSYHLLLLGMGVPNFCPQLSGAFPSAWTDVDYEKWLAFDYAVIDRCTHVLMLPRWEISVGAKRERDYAEERGIPVVYTVAELINVLPLAVAV
jgi:hypothetical protein